MRVRYSPRAVRDIDDIRRYIKKDNPRAAWVVAAFIKRSIALLEEWPYHGRATDKENVRRLVVTNYPYVVYYLVADEGVIILHVRHTSRHP
jgi:addiction module RelE/StbE family toxin